MNKLSSTLTILFLSMIVSSPCSYASVMDNTANRLPPYYIQVPGWQKCTKSKSMGTWQAVCLPNKKPAKCISSSWQDLQKKAHLSPC